MNFQDITFTINPESPTTLDNIAIQFDLVAWCYNPAVHSIDNGQIIIDINSGPCGVPPGLAPPAEVGMLEAGEYDLLLGDNIEWNGYVEQVSSFTVLNSTHVGAHAVPAIGTSAIVMLSLLIGYIARKKSQL